MQSIPGAIWDVYTGMRYTGIRATRSDNDVMHVLVNFTFVPQCQQTSTILVKARRYGLIIEIVTIGLIAAGQYIGSDLYLAINNCIKKLNYKNKRECVVVLHCLRHPTKTDLKNNCDEQKHYRGHYEKWKTCLNIVISLDAV